MKLDTIFWILVLLFLILWFYSIYFTPLTYPY